MVPYAPAIMKNVFLFAALAVVLAGCTTFRPHEPLPVVNQVNLDRLMGTWYVIASVPTVLDPEPYNATETYQRGDRGIEITYEFNAGSPDGKLKSYTRNAMVDNPGINSDWEVSRIWPFRNDYKIIYLEPDYSVAVIGHPNRKDVTIMARKPSIDPPLYSDIVLFLQRKGYDVGKIRKVPHS